MSLNELLEMNDEEVFELVDEEYELSKKQAALYEIMHDMINRLEKLKQHEAETKSELDRLKMENTFLRNLVKDISKCKSLLFS